MRLHMTGWDNSLKALVSTVTNWKRSVQMSQITTQVYKKNNLLSTSLLADLSINMRRQEVPIGLSIQEILVNLIYMNELKRMRMKFPTVKIKFVFSQLFISTATIQVFVPMVSTFQSSGFIPGYTHWPIDILTSYLPYSLPFI